ncbi:MAG: DUF3780 domain-containing protein [Spirochaetales bacterium]|nr:DUF3780 domain-containing protein [Spirochaetales bacterium]
MSEVLGFGFFPERTTHCFLVHIPSSKDGEVAITEEFKWTAEALSFEKASSGYQNPDLKVLLPMRIWAEIAEEARAEFNRRLIRHGVKSGKWPSKGVAPVDRNLGKELVLLAWAVEEADPVLIPNAVRNWLGLSPEERWWLFTMTNAATGQALGGRNKGWRKAVRFALTENPIADSVIKKRMSDFELPLFRE